MILSRNTYHEFEIDTFAIISTSNNESVVLRVADIVESYDDFEYPETVYMLEDEASSEWMAYIASDMRPVPA